MVMNLDYIAGFFDGEGSAHILVVHRPTTTFGFTFHPRACISQKSPEVLKEIRDYLGIGKLSLNRGQWKLSFDSLISAKNFAELVKDRCFLRRAPLELMLEAIELKLRYGGKGRELPKAIATQMTYILDALHIINQRGNGTGREIKYKGEELRQKIIAWHPKKGEK